MKKHSLTWFLLCVASLVLFASCGKKVETWDEELWERFGIGGLKPPTRFEEYSGPHDAGSEALFSFEAKNYSTCVKYVKKSFDYVIKTADEVYYLPEKWGALPDRKVESWKNLYEFGDGDFWSVIYKKDGIYYCFAGSVANFPSRRIPYTALISSCVYEIR